MKSIIPSILVAILIVGSAIAFSSKSASPTTGRGEIRVVDGKQEIAILAKGGYYPPMSLAKTGLPSVLKIKTSSTFDCSSALSIPALGYRDILPNSGETLIDILPQEPSTVITGICAMGMYNFQIKFD